MLIMAAIFGDSRFNLLSEDIRTYLISKLYDIAPAECAALFLGRPMWKCLNGDQIFNPNPNAPQEQRRDLLRKFIRCQSIAFCNAFFTVKYMTTSVAVSTIATREETDAFFGNHYRTDLLARHTYPRSWRLCPAEKEADERTALAGAASMRSWSRQHENSHSLVDVQEVSGSELVELESSVFVLFMLIFDFRAQRIDTNHS